MKSGSGADILVTNVVANPPPPCAVHNFAEWAPATIWDLIQERPKEHGMYRICRDCGRYEWTEGLSV